MAAGLAAGGQEDQLGARLGRVLAGQDAVRLDPCLEPRRAVRVRRQDDERPRGVAAGQPLDRLGGALADLRLPRDDDEVHHRRPRGDVPARRLALLADQEVGLRPDPVELGLDLVDRVRVREPAHRRLAGLRRVRQLDPAAAGGTRPDRDDLAELAAARVRAALRGIGGPRDRLAALRGELDVRRGSPPRPRLTGHRVRSGASADRRGRAGLRPPRDPTSRPRSWGTRAAPSRPRRR